LISNLFFALELQVEAAFSKMLPGSSMEFSLGVFNGPKLPDGEVSLTIQEPQRKHVQKMVNSCWISFFATNKPQVRRVVSIPSFNIKPVPSASTRWPLQQKGWGSATSFQGDQQVSNL